SGCISKCTHTRASRVYLGDAAMTQILEAMQRAGNTETAALIKALEGHEFDGLKEVTSILRASDHQHVQDVLVGEAYGKELGLGHYKILSTVAGSANAGASEQQLCKHCPSMSRGRVSPPAVGVNRLLRDQYFDSSVLARPAFGDNGVHQLFLD